MDFVVQIMVWLNRVANALGRVLLAPLAMLPGWLSATLVAVVTGVVMLVIFKYTSNQAAIKRVRDDIKASLLSLKLFKDSASVVVRAQGRVLRGALWLLVLSFVPMLVMIVPVCLMMTQLALWYQVRPLHVGEQAVLTLELNGDPTASFPQFELEPTDALKVTTGPVRVPSQRAVYWNVEASQPGDHRLEFEVDGQTAEKELAVGEGFMKVSMARPSWHWEDVLLHPKEEPFPPDSPFKAIRLEYPARDSWTSGTDWWIVYWFAVSMVAAFCLRGTLGVNI